MREFTHLHVHTQYSILDGAASIEGLIAKCKKDEMKALAITEHGNMFGVKEFHKLCKKAGIKPIIGCEAYVTQKSRFDKEGADDRSGDHLIILAKNKTGYKNLVKLVSYAWTEGFYYKPRIDKELLRKYSEGLIISSACLGGEIPQAIMQNNLEKAEKTALEFKELFGDDFYLELQRHQSGNAKMDNDVYNNQVLVNKHLIELSQKLNIKYIATNDVHFIEKEDSEAHDILICLNTGKDLDDPTRMRYTGMEYLKTREEMTKLFSDLPEAIDNTQEIVAKVEEYEIDSKPIMPNFPLPENFTDTDEYLRYRTYEGAKERYGDVLDEVTTERIEFELATIKKMGFPGYFLIIWDFLKAAREMGVSVGPGRGSAAGSVVAYCLRIIDIDPIKYNLLFERFLNPDRISMPDIDIDLDEDGRENVIKWVVEKYGKQRVAQIVTFGTMAAKMAIRDVARVMKLPLPDADRLAKMVPEKPGTTLAKAYIEVPELAAERKSSNPLIAKTLRFAEILEGSIRNTGVHACGVIIGRDDLEEHVALCRAKDAELNVVQFEGKFVEDVGLLKMDFLGLKTLSIIKDAVENIKLSKGITIDNENLPLNDKKTYELYSRGETTGLFQFESDGMKKYLKELEPDRFEDLIAMNALYRPGPIAYIPSYINRRHGREKINYDLPEMEEILKDTYGVTVYQEQVMLLSQKLAGFTKGQADSLRKAMGKKLKAMMDELKVKFIDGCKNNGHDPKIAEKVWGDWEAFAEYAFNKSHSTCYAFVSYQTAYLKAHYPAEFMAAVLSRNLNDIKKITFFMDECRRMGIKVLCPDVNESYANFTVNKKGEIRFGLAAIKGVGEAAVNSIIENRKEKGAFKSIYDFAERVNLSAVNKRTIENLILSGAFDSFGEVKRSQFFTVFEGDQTFLEALVKYGSRMQGENDNNQQNLFGGFEPVQIKKPEPATVEDWPQLEKLNKEKDLIGIYLSAHPLDKYKTVADGFCNAKLADLAELKSIEGKEIKVAGIVTSVSHRLDKNGKPYGDINIEDYSGNYQIRLFNSKYVDYKNFFSVGYPLYVKGKIQHRYDKPELDLEFNITSIELLSDIQIKNITIKVPIENIDEQMINAFQELVSEHQGSTLLKFIVFDPSTKVWVQMFSKTYKVTVSQEFTEALKNIPTIEYKLF